MVQNHEHPGTEQPQENEIGWESRADFTRYVTANVGPVLFIPIYEHPEIKPLNQAIYYYAYTCYIKKIEDQLDTIQFNLSPDQIFPPEPQKLKSNFKSYLIQKAQETEEILKKELGKPKKTKVLIDSARMDLERYKTSLKMFEEYIAQEEPS